MKAMILAAGEGTRLRPLSLSLPKVLAPLNGAPLLQFTLEWLKRHGVRQVAINLCHLGPKILDFCSDGSRFDLRITYSWEEAPLGTAGGVKKIAGFFDQAFIVVYGDVLTNLDLSRMMRWHKLKRGVATIAAHKVVNPWQSGVVSLNRHGQIVEFVEKPRLEAEPECLVNGGVYILEKSILNYIPDDGYCDFGYDVFPMLISSGIPIYAYILGDEEYLIDIGDWEHYGQAINDLKTGKVRVLP